MLKGEERAHAVLLPLACYPALSTGHGAEQLWNQASGMARGASLGLGVFCWGYSGYAVPGSPRSRPQTMRPRE